MYIFFLYSFIVHIIHRNRIIFYFYESAYVQLKCAAKSYRTQLTRTSEITAFVIEVKCIERVYRNNNFFNEVLTKIHWANKILVIIKSYESGKKSDVIN